MLIQPVLRPVLQPVLRSIFDPGIGGGGTPIWTPASLFAASEQGVWLDESDLSSMFQDLAGTVPAAVDSPVGKRLDKSGNGNHWTAASSAARPVLRLTGGLYSLQWDGVDDGGSTPSINFTATDKMGVFVGCSTTSTANQGVIGYESAAGKFNTLYAANALPTMRGSLNGDTGSSQIKVAGQMLGVGGVYAQLYDLAGATVTDEIKIRFNGTLPTQDVAAPGPAGGGNFGNAVLSVGHWLELFFLEGHTYGEIVVGKMPSAPEIAGTEAWLAAKTGVVLP